MNDLQKLKTSILMECEDDYMGLWSVIRDAEEVLPDRDECVVREQVIEALRELLAADEIEAGYPTSDGRSFQSLRLPPDEVVVRINQDWPIGHRMTIGEGLWFTKAQTRR